MAGNPLSKKVRTALDETRLLILGAQVLFGFQLEAVFQNQFSTLPLLSRSIACAAVLLMTIAVACLVTPSMLHRIAEGGEDTQRILRSATLWAGISLLPFALSIGLDFYVVFELVTGRPGAVVAGFIFFGLAGAFWYGFEFMSKQHEQVAAWAPIPASTPLSTKIENMLREARVILPGAQALLGFQFVVILTKEFAALEPLSQGLHLAALCFVAFATILLMTPAALHRITYAGEDSEEFLKRGSRFVTTAPFFLGLGIAADLYVVTTAAVQSHGLGVAIGMGAFILLSILWYGVPFAIRKGKPT
ncbi:MAG: hypothetical protein JO230_24360 [Xanthobacteraceae bacterium]|nr:hypothetical protein [Xanthobacteraceae bacterium]